MTHYYSDKRLILAQEAKKPFHLPKSPLKTLLLKNNKQKTWLLKDALS